MMASEKGGGAGPGHVGTHEGQTGPGRRQAAGLSWQWVGQCLARWPE